jgi:hypothetical protein
MLKTRYFFVVAALLFGGRIAHAEDACGNKAAAIVRQAYPEAKASADGFSVGAARITLPTADASDDDAHALICHAWPAYPERLLVAVPLMTKIDDDGNEGDLDLLVIDRNSLKVESRLRLHARMNDDAVRIADIQFDTARYRLTPNQSAFGLRISLEGSSRPDPFGEVDLSLYVIDHDTLRPVLDGIVISKNGGEWDTQCAGTFDETHRTLAMDKATHNGYTDILVTEKSSSTKASVGKNGDCEQKISKQDQPAYRLSYDGKTYPVPKALKPLE